MTELTSPEIEIDLGDDKLVLKCTPGAGLKISRHFGGFLPASQRVMSFDADAVAAVIQYGAGISDKEAKGLAERIVEAGIGKLAPKATTYITYLLNAGRVERTEGQGEA